MNETDRQQPELNNIKLWIGVWFVFVTFLQSTGRHEPMTTTRVVVYVISSLPFDGVYVLNMDSRKWKYIQTLIDSLEQPRYISRTIKRRTDVDCREQGGSRPALSIIMVGHTSKHFTCSPMTWLIDWIIIDNIQTQVYSFFIKLSPNYPPPSIVSCQWQQWHSHH